MWLNSVYEEMSAIKPEDFIEPSTEVGLNDYVAGTMSNELRKLYTLMEKSRNENRKNIEEKIENIFSLLLDSLKFDIGQASKKLLTLYDIFWISLRDEFNLWDKDSVGVRKGFAVVWTEENKEPDKEPESKCKEEEKCDGNCEECISPLAPIIMSLNKAGSLKKKSEGKRRF